MKIVPVSTLDNVLGGRLLNQRLFIKIDAEGAECQVLSGAHATLARELKPIWLLEVCLHEFRPEGTNADYLKIIQMFWDNNYRACTATKIPTLVTPADVDNWVRQKFCDSGTVNYLFADPEYAGKWLSK
jgi:Methyltransferase FkbM domain